MSMDSHPVSSVVPFAVLTASAAAKGTQKNFTHASERKNGFVRNRKLHK